MVSPECTLPSPRRHPWASQRFVAWVSVNEQDRGRAQDRKKVWPSSGPSQTFTCRRAPYFVTISSVTMCPISLRHRAQKNQPPLPPTFTPTCPGFLVKREHQLRRLLTPYPRGCPSTSHRGLMHFFSPQGQEIRAAA